MEHLTKSQLEAFIRTLVFAKREWEYAALQWKTNPTYDHPIAITKHYKLYNAKCRDAVLSAFDIFFERTTRGHSIGENRSSSKWKPRPKNIIMRLCSTHTQSYEVVMSKIKEIYEANKDLFHETRTVVFSTEKNGKSVTVMTKEFIWQHEILREVFEPLAVGTWQENDDAKSLFTDKKGKK